MGDHNEPIFDEVRVSPGGPRATASASIEKNQQHKRNMLAAEETANALPTSLIYGRLRDLKFAVEEGNDVVSDLFAKFDSVLSPETESNEGPSSDTNVLSTNSELYDAIGQLERHVRKQHLQLRYLMERCEL